MSTYEKQNFEDGQILSASQLNYIENGIMSTLQDLSKLQEDLNTVNEKIPEQGINETIDNKINTKFNALITRYGYDVYSNEEYNPSWGHHFLMMFGYYALYMCIVTGGQNNYHLDMAKVYENERAKEQITMSLKNSSIDPTIIFSTGDINCNVTILWL